jgi:peptidoglycan/xylan/chitin deacetylase (PgdA/CDA1 family)
MEFLQIEKLKSTKFPLKSQLSKISFELGRNPKVEKASKSINYIPKPYKAVLIISADFELAWAFRFSKNQKDPVANAKLRAQRARKNVLKILELCEKYDVPITWATVGHLFLESCSKDNGKAHENLENLNHFESPFWKFDSGDWFKDDPCSNFKKDPEWYAPDLIKNIIDSKVKHEIGSHTFSHIDCRESVCSPSVFKSELNECIKVAEPYNVKLKSFVFPGHTFGNFDLLPEYGFTSYRTNYRNILGYPIKHPNGLWEHESSAEFNIRPTWSTKYQIYRYKKIIDRAIKNKTNCHFWFHPSVNSQFVSDIMPSVLEYISQRKDEIFITTMGEYTDWLNNNA